MRHFKGGQQRVVPRVRVDVPQHRAARVRLVRRVDASASQPPEQPRVDRAEREVARDGPRLRAGNRIEDEAHLRRAEVGVDHEAGTGTHLIGQTARAQVVANRSRLARLPHDGGVDRPTRGALPDERSLPLVRDADGRHHGSRDTRPREDTVGGCQLAFPDRLRIVLHPPGLRVRLRKLPLVNGDGAGLFVKQDRAR